MLQSVLRLPSVNVTDTAAVAVAIASIVTLVTATSSDLQHCQSSSPNYAQFNAVNVPETYTTTPATEDWTAMENAASDTSKFNINVVHKIKF